MCESGDDVSLGPPVRAALPALKQAVSASGDASVINISSIYGQVAPVAGLYDRREQQSPFHYGPAKAGLEQLTRELLLELAALALRTVRALGAVEQGLEGVAAGAAHVLVDRHGCRAG